MTNKYDVMQSYGFIYTDCDGKVYNKTINTPGATWYECMDDYVKFLESVFGYAIKPQVRLEQPMWLDTMYEYHSDYIDPWTGEYFVKEDEEVPKEAKIDEVLAAEDWWKVVG